jgi:eukaryotic-like serine/threonine-protein kinase
MSSEAVAHDPVFDTALGETWGLPTLGSTVNGRFRIGPTLGEGGMSAVFLAHDERLGRDVALKLLSPRLAHSREIVTRFVNEARTLARLDSEHIVRVLDAGVTSEPEQTPLPYMVLELLRGHDLRTECARGPVEDPERALGWVLEACEGLAVAHAEGVIHRDLKPENLFIARTADGSEVVKLLDFGIARSLAVHSSLTHSGEGIGSPGYMSPEQLNDASTVDERSDIWSLGVVLYELLAGVPPFHSHNTFELCAQILAGKPARLSRFREDLPRGLVAAVQRCLEVDPDDRFESISELVSALAPYCPTFASSAAASIQRRLEARASGELLSGLDEAPVDPRAATELANDNDLPSEEPAGVTRTERRWRARRLVSHTVGWLAVLGMLLLLGRAYAPAALPSSSDVLTEARGTMERVTEAARTAWERAADAPNR